MSIENKKISDDELDNVNGGCNSSMKNVDFPGNLSNYSDYTIPVDKYCGQIGTKYLFYCNYEKWAFGKLVNTYEQKDGLILTTRTHDILIEDAYGLDHNNSSTIMVNMDAGGTKELNGGVFQMLAKG